MDLTHNGPDAVRYLSDQQIQHGGARVILPPVRQLLEYLGFATARPCLAAEAGDICQQRSQFDK